ncbi:MAG TPA: DNA polymerase/3'-5' exonuclease PolX [Candidatus Binatia bacterium]|nr:DNA polymerase/3'-5' exonuclease PolX [Candidatus Binatia bacterium]
MENVEIARTLNEYAALLDIQGESPFRVRAYRKAAQTLAGLSQSVEQRLREDGDLTALPGIGARMAAHIEEIVKTGTLTALEQTQQEVPRSLAELTKLETLGPKKAKQLYDQLGITSVAELRTALDAGQVERLPGFGAKSVERLRRALTEATARARRLRLVDAEQLLQPLLAHMRHAPGIEQFEVAGSFRRRKETVGDIDILAACDTPQPVMAHFLSYPQGKRVEGAGATRGTLILRSGLQVDLRVVPRRSYGAALQYFTGSQAHGVAVRKLGVERGLRINEYGVFRVSAGSKNGKAHKEAGRRVGGATEEEVYRAVGMAWVPPELREDHGEVDAARHNALPRLVTLGDIRGNLHMHSRWTDGAQTIEEMARACKELGYEYCAITDHSQSTRVAGGLDAAGFKKQWQEVEQVRRRLDGITLLAGIEVDILPDGSLDLPDDVLEAFDIVVASVHSHLQMPQPEITRRILKAVAHPAVDILAHPTERLLNKREPMAADIEAVLRAAKEHGVAVELNAQPDRLDLNDVQVRRARELGVKVAINSDAHSTENLRFMRYGVDQARRGWLEKRDVLNTMGWQEFRRWLQRRG